MTLLHLGYGLLISALLCVAATLAEAGLRGARRPARWVWLLAVAFSATAPIWGPRVSARTALIPASQAAPIASTGDGAAPAALPAIWTRARVELARPRPELTGVWGAMALIATTLMGVGMIRLERRAGRLPRTEIGGEEVALSDDFGPALVGLRRPRTVLPRWVLSLARREVGLILAHERAHRTAGDGRLLALGLLAVAACPWNPLVWLQFRRLRDAVEMDCDRRLLRGGVAFPAYARVLVLVRLRAAGVGGGAVALVESSSSLERRLKTMREFTWTRRRVALTGAAALAIVVVACETPAPSDVEVDEVAETEIASELVSQATSRLIRLRTPEGEAAAPQPLIVVDGVILNEGRLSDIRTDDIARIEVIKGAAAREIYGERAQNGVVNIFTEGEVPLSRFQVRDVKGNVREEPGDPEAAGGVIREMRERVPLMKERPGGGS